LAAVCTIAVAVPAHADSVRSVRELSSGIEVQTEEGVLTVEPWSDSVVHVRFGPAGYRGNYNPAVIASPEKVRFSIRQTADAYVLTTSKLNARIAKATAGL
jgi:alpha-D-xyloside xylohydrolase